MGAKKNETGKSKSIYIDRLDKIRKALGIKTAATFCMEANIDKNLLSSGQKELTTRHLVPILTKFPQVNPYYILLGIGEPVIEGFGKDDSFVAKYVINELQNVQMEVRTLITENTKLKCQLERQGRKRKQSDAKSTDKQKD
ncbi:hypothetical protein [Prevotella pectinovora]|uniref:hypothetical protein n=1 Tax=Prevotella pectinovora TaxID=1602169 RepID=UPI003A94D174